MKCMSWRQGEWNAELEARRLICMSWRQGIRNVWGLREGLWNTWVNTMAASMGTSSGSGATRKQCIAQETPGVKGSEWRRPQVRRAASGWKPGCGRRQASEATNKWSGEREAHRLREAPGEPSPPRTNGFTSYLYVEDSICRLGLWEFRAGAVYVPAPARFA